jgi:AbrB family looped-hinge helix DNA binding protein
MNSSTYTLKISPQGQLTLPKQLRDALQLREGGRVTVAATVDGSLQLSGKLPIEQYFGSLANTWTEDGQDASEYSRELRNAMQPKVG